MNLVRIDHDSPVGPGEQLRGQFEVMIAGGVLEAGTRLPSVRQLAADLGLAAGTVARVYKELEGSGHVITSRTGTVVAALGQRADEERRRHLDEAARTFVDRTTRAGVRLSEALEAVRVAYRTTAQPAPE